jgi:hypothetical protein
MKKMCEVVLDQSLNQSKKNVQSKPLRTPQRAANKEKALVVKDVCA